MNKVATESVAKSPTRYWRVIKGRLYARLQYKDETGKAREKVRPIEDKRTARTVVEEMRRELVQHGEETLKSDKMTFREVAEIYKAAKLIPAVYANNVKVAGRKSNVEWAYRAAIDFFGHKVVRSIKPRDLEAFKNSRLEGITNRGRTRNIATVNRELSLVRSMMNYALQNDWILTNPFSKVKGLIVSSAETERDRVLSFEEEARMLAVCVERRAHLRPILLCALDTGMRAGEMFKLIWKDVDFTSNQIHIVQTNTKTEESRTVGMTPRLKDELELLWQTSPKDENGLVFGITDSVKHAWTTACTKAEVTDFRLHDCRHTATTRMIAAGCPHTEVMKITGHSQLKTFLRYLNITAESANRVASNLHTFVTANAVGSPGTKTAVGEIETPVEFNPDILDSEILD
jgi:integrase